MQKCWPKNLRKPNTSTTLIKSQVKLCVVVCFVCSGGVVQIIDIQSYGERWKKSWGLKWKKEKKKSDSGSGDKGRR